MLKSFERRMKDRKAVFFEAGNEALLRPKIDIQMKNVAGKEETAFYGPVRFVGPSALTQRI